MPIPNKGLLEFGIQNSSVSVFGIGIGIGQYRAFFGIGTGIGIDNPGTYITFHFACFALLSRSIETMAAHRNEA